MATTRHVPHRACVMESAVYPGTFDPPTLGHLDLIRRAARLFDKLIVAVGNNPMKGMLFTAEERAEMLREMCRQLQNVEIEVFEGLLVELARRRGVKALVRGLRAVSDFENEFQMALTNRTLADEVETVFLMTSADQMFVSSSIVKEVAALGGDVSSLVPEHVAKLLAEKAAEQR